MGQFPFHMPYGPLAQFPFQNKKQMRGNQAQGIHQSSHRWLATLSMIAEVLLVLDKMSAALWTKVQTNLPFEHTFWAQKHTERAKVLVDLTNQDGRETCSHVFKVEEETVGLSL